MLQKLKPFTKKKNNDVRKQQQKLFVRTFDLSKETQDLERVIALGLIVINSASKQTHARTHIDIHPTIIKTNDSTTGGEHSITNTIHMIYIWCASVKLL